MALKQLYPTANPLLDYTVIDNGSGPQVIYWNESKLGAQPSTAQLAAALAQVRSAQDSRNIRRARLRALVSTIVGKDVVSLSALEVRAILAIVLERLGVLDDTGRIQPVVLWGESDEIGE